MRHLSFCFLLAMPAFGFTQNVHSKNISIAYEGGSITHPGLSIGYGIQLKQISKWKLVAAAKAGFYYHHRYQTAIFILPGLQLNHISKKGFLWGVDLQVGPQRTFIPNVYEVDDNGKIEKDKGAGIFQWVIAPAFRIGGDLSVKRNLPIQWFINPQLQFRNPTVGRNEKYFLLGIGINYKLD